MLRRQHLPLLLLLQTPTEVGMLSVVQHSPNHSRGQHFRLILEPNPRSSRALQTLERNRPISTIRSASSHRLINKHKILLRSSSQSLRNNSQGNKINLQTFRPSNKQINHREGSPISGNRLRIRNQVSINNNNQINSMEGSPTSTRINSSSSSSSSQISHKEDLPTSPRISNTKPHLPNNRLISNRVVLPTSTRINSNSRHLLTSSRISKEGLPTSTRTNSNRPHLPSSFKINKEVLQILTRVSSNKHQLPNNSQANNKEVLPTSTRINNRSLRLPNKGSIRAAN